MTAPDAAGGSRSGSAADAGIGAGVSAGISKRKLRAYRLGKPAGTGPTSAAGRGAFGAERPQARPQRAGDA